MLNNKKINLIYAKESYLYELFLDKQLNIDDKETAIMAILNGMYCNKYGHLSTSVSLIGYEITGRFLKTSNKRERTIIDGIRSAIQSLMKKRIIEIINQDNDNYIFSGKGLEVNSDKKKFCCFGTMGNAENI